MEDGGIITELPMGWRFQPSDMELIFFYLENKVYFRPLPAQVIKELDSDEFFSKHPRKLIPEEDISGETEFYFFIHNDRYFRGNFSRERSVGDGSGTWKSTPSEDPIYGVDGEKLAYKHISKFYEYGQTRRGGLKKTNWCMVEYRLNVECGQESHVGEWVVARLSKSDAQEKE